MEAQRIPTVTSEVCHARSARTARCPHISGGVLLFIILAVMALGGTDLAIAADRVLKNGPDPDYHWKASMAPTYLSGTYGTDTRTNIFYLPFTLKRLFSKGDISLTVPFISIEGTGAVRLVDGVGTRTSKSSSGNSGNVKSKKVKDGPQDTATRSSGLGDIILRGRYYALEESTFMPLVALTARIKMPTASEDKGLGTGEFDEGLGVELYKRLSTRWSAFVDGGYTFIGDPDGVEFRNRWWYDVGAGYDVNKFWHVSLYYEEYRALVNSVNNARDLLFFGVFKPTSAFRATGSVLVGLSNGAPNYGFTGGVSYRF